MLPLPKSYTSDDLPFKRTENNGEVLSYYAPDTHNGIMSQADFDKVQALLQRKSVGPCPRKDTAFSKMLYCAKCGSMLSRKINRSSQVTWICRTHLRCAADCSTSPIQEERIQHVFLTMHNKLIVNHAQIFTPALHDLYAAQRFSMIRRASGRNSTSRFICLPKSCTTFPVCAKRTASPPLNTGNGAIHWSVNSRM